MKWLHSSNKRLWPVAEIVSTPGSVPKHPLVKDGERLNKQGCFSPPGLWGQGPGDLWPLCPHCLAQSLINEPQQYFQLVSGAKNVWIFGNYECSFGRIDAALEVCALFFCYKQMCRGDVQILSMTCRNPGHLDLGSPEPHGRGSCGNSCNKLAHLFNMLLLPSAKCMWARAAHALMKRWNTASDPHELPVQPGLGCLNNDTIKNTHTRTRSIWKALLPSAEEGASWDEGGRTWMVSGP